MDRAAEECDCSRAIPRITTPKKIRNLTGRIFSRLGFTKGGVISPPGDSNKRFYCGTQVATSLRGGVQQRIGSLAIGCFISNCVPRSNYAHECSKMQRADRMVKKKKRVLINNLMMKSMPSCDNEDWWIPLKVI